MKEGEQIYCALCWSEHPPPKDFSEAYSKLVAHLLATKRLTLKGLTDAPTGALIAAPTTSLPETSSPTSPAARNMHDVSGALLDSVYLVMLYEHAAIVDAASSCPSHRAKPS